MKKILFLAAAFVFTAASALAQQSFDSLIKVNTEKHDFGKIKQSVPVDYFFELTNISDKPIVVERTWATCGCTTPEAITEPIMPGATTKLKIQYNAAALAPFSKDVYIKLAGIEQPKTVHVTGEVLSAEAYDAYVKEKNIPKTPNN